MIDISEFCITFAVVIITILITMLPDKALEKLQECGINPSVQRIAIMNYLLTTCSHPTAEDVYTALSEAMPTLSRTTVYNTLRLFAEHGAARMLTIDERKVCFDGQMHPHAHFLCRRCNALYDMPLPENVEPEPKLTVPEGYEVEEVHYYYRGLCRKCRDREEEKD